MIDGAIVQSESSKGRRGEMGGPQLIVICLLISMIKVCGVIRYYRYMRFIFQISKNKFEKRK